MTLLKTTKEEDYEMAILLLAFIIAAGVGSWLTKWGYFETYGILALIMTCLALLACLIE
jgi:hypothetical protein